MNFPVRTIAGSAPLVLASLQSTSAAAELSRKVCDYLGCLGYSIARTNPRQAR